jgi:hypothetical protein
VKEIYAGFLIHISTHISIPCANCHRRPTYQSPQRKIRENDGILQSDKGVEFHATIDNGHFTKEENAPDIRKEERRA